MTKGIRTFYTDGSVYGNGSPEATGAYSWVEVDDRGKIIVEYASSEDKSGVVPTNIRMEMMGVISALHYSNTGDNILIRSDSAYLINGMNQKWYKKWFSTGKNSTGAVPKNLDLWIDLVRCASRTGTIVFEHIKGHSGNVYNERCDELAGLLNNNSSMNTYSRMY